jgi:hypothetical protein
MKTHTLDFAAAKICGEDSGMKDPRGWLLRGIRAGRFQARKVGRHYRMTDEQINAAIEAVTTKNHTTPLIELEDRRPRGLSLTATSARRIKVVGR